MLDLPLHHSLFVRSAAPLAPGNMSSAIAGYEGKIGVAGVACIAPV